MSPEATIRLLDSLYKIDHTISNGLWWIYIGLILIFLQRIYK